jgi:cytochrome P450
MTLSDGTYLPKGTWLCAPSLAISSDPEVYLNSDAFDGLRFFKLRERSAADENKHQFTSTSKTMLHFGAGRHACPGRVSEISELLFSCATQMQMSHRLWHFLNFLFEQMQMSRRL